MYAALVGNGKREWRYGWGRYTPPALQIFNSPISATGFFCMASLLQGIIINGLLHYFLPTIERRFHLSSTESGCMSGAYDIAALICLLPVTYLGGRRRAHRPRYIGYGVIIMGTGSFIFGLPAFLVGPYRQKVMKELCTPGIKNLQQMDPNNYTLYFWILFFGNFLHGIGASPLYTLVVTYIDENVPVQHASLYLGFYYMMAVMGPFIGFITGGALAQLDEDRFFLSYQTRKSELTPDSSAWVGMWWFGFIVCGMACYVFSLPILGLPKEMPETEVHRSERGAEPTEVQHMTFTSLHDLPFAIYQVIRNLKFLFITFAGCCEAIIFSGMSAFLTKLLHLQFGLNPSEVAIYMCILIIPSTLSGILFGGWIIKCRKMNIKEILSMAVIFMIITVPCVYAVFISCPNKNIAGVTIPYPIDGEKFRSTIISLDSDCNIGCECDGSNYSPICGVDGIEYYSPCYAGCLKKSKINKRKVFMNCLCITKGTNNTIDAKDYRCKVDCPLFPLFIILFFIYQFFSFSTLIPSVTSTLRVTEFDYRSLALGVQWLFGRALGTIPGPILFGKAIDDSCLHWAEVKGARGNCLLYDHSMLSRNLGMVILTFKFFSIVFFSLALYLALRRK